MKKLVNIENIKKDTRERAEKRGIDLSLVEKQKIGDEAYLESGDAKYLYVSKPLTDFLQEIEDVLLEIGVDKKNATITLMTKEKKSHYSYYDDDDDIYVHFYIDYERLETDEEAARRAIKEHDERIKEEKKKAKEKERKRKEKKKKEEQERKMYERLKKKYEKTGK